MPIPPMAPTVPIAPTALMPPAGLDVRPATLQRYPALRELPPHAARVRFALLARLNRLLGPALGLINFEWVSREASLGAEAAS